MCNVHKQQSAWFQKNNEEHKIVLLTAVWVLRPKSACCASVMWLDVPSLLAGPALLYQSKAHPLATDKELGCKRHDGGYLVLSSARPRRCCCWEVSV